MLLSGGMSFIDRVLVEWHENFAGSEERKIQSQTLRKSLDGIANSTREFDIVELNDESFWESDFDLPKCKMLRYL